MAGGELVYSFLGKEYRAQDQACGANRLQRFASELIDHGLLYALANFRIHSPEPLPPLENWKYWTDPKPVWLEGLVRAYPPRPRRKAYLDAMLREDHASGIEAHYDVSNDFYALFLDKQYKFYTCADFHASLETLEEAQVHKAEFICGLLRLSGGEKILDLGCGWGGMLKFLREVGHWGDLTGLTLSQEQLAYARKQEGFSVALSDFIAEPFGGAPYERLYSIGALEHARPTELLSLYQKMHDALVSGGLAVHQFFSYRSDPYPISVAIL